MMPLEYGPTQIGMAIELGQTIAVVGLIIARISTVNMVGSMKQVIIGHGMVKQNAIG